MEAGGAFDLPPMLFEVSCKICSFHPFLVDSHVVLFIAVWYHYLYLV